MNERITADICVIGAGSGGLSVAAGAALLGAETVLIEKDRMGGDCLNTGCIPSKALLAAAQVAETVRGAARFGIGAGKPEIDFAAVNDHIRSVIEGIAPNDSVERFEGLGIRVIRAAGRFTGPREVVAGGVEVAARRFVVATGSRAAVPPIPGLAEVPYLTNETIFDLRDAPAHLIVIGAGPIGTELAQAHRRLGCRVTMLEMSSLLPRDDPELVDILRRRLLGEGIDLREGVAVERVAGETGRISVTIDEGGETRTVEGSHLLVAAGRRPNVEDLGLDEAGIAYTDRGLEVNARLRTSNRRVYAVGDVAGGPQFTHLAAHHAGVVIRNTLFRLPARADRKAIPWVTYTAPELAHIGLGEAEARAAHGEVRILRWAFAENDRARTERATDGLIKVITTRRGRVLGADILGPHAGELILPWILAVDRRLGIGALAGIVAPYPTLGEIGKRAAGSYFTPSLFGERTKRIVRFLGRFG
ncbi:MAG: dihydrolipoyl dehydrogenase family protein [Alphaproteobacteria bacterium]